MRCSQVGKAIDFESMQQWFESTHLNFMTYSSVVERSAVNRDVASSNLAGSVYTNLAQLGECLPYKQKVASSGLAIRIAH